MWAYGRRAGKTLLPVMQRLWLHSCLQASTVPNAPPHTLHSHRPKGYLTYFASTHPLPAAQAPTLTARQGGVQRRHPYAHLAPKVHWLQVWQEPLPAASWHACCGVFCTIYTSLALEVGLSSCQGSRESASVLQLLTLGRLAVPKTTSSRRARWEDGWRNGSCFPRRCESASCAIQQTVSTGMQAHNKATAHEFAARHHL